MERKNGKRNGHDAGELGSSSPPTRDPAVKESSNGRRQIDCQTSQLKRRILPKHVDGRSKEAKRLVGLVQDFATLVQDPNSPLVRARLMAAALLVMQQEAMAHQIAAGHAVDPDDVVRIHNATERALARLASA